MSRLAGSIIGACSVVSAVCLVTLAAPKMISSTNSQNTILNSRLVAAAPSYVLPVYPQTAASAAITDLSTLVASLLPPKGFSGLDWAFAVGNPRVAWQTEGVLSEGQQTVRVGYARVRVAGKVSTVLRRQLDELAWSVTLLTDGPAKFGPQGIDISPGVLPNMECFGTLFEGCSFSAADALTGGGLKARQVCTTGSEGNGDKVYAVTANGGVESLVVVSTSRGSGGDSASIAILPMSMRETA